MIMPTHKLRKFFNNYYLEIIFLTCLFVILLRVIPAYEWLPDQWRSYILNYYVLNYQDAGHFLSRALIGSVLRLFVQTINSRIFYSIFWLIYLGAYSFVGFGLIHKIKKEDNLHLSFLIVAITIFNPAVMNYALDFARPDIFMVFITLLAVYLIYKEKFMFLLPFLCVMGMLIHEAFIIIFVPLIATYLLEKIIKKPGFINIFSFMALVVLCFSAFYVILTFGKNSIDNLKAFQTLLQNRIDIPLNPDMVYFEQGAAKGELNNVAINELSYYKTQIGLLFYLLIFLPIIIPYVKFLNRMKKTARNRFTYFLFAIAPFSGMLMIVIGVDYGRWFSMLITCCLIRLYYLLKEYNYKLTDILTVTDISKSSILLVAVLVIYITIGPMGDLYEHFDYLNFINNMFNYFRGY